MHHLLAVLYFLLQYHLFPQPIQPILSIQILGLFQNSLVENPKFSTKLLFKIYLLLRKILYYNNITILLFQLNYGILLVACPPHKSLPVHCPSHWTQRESQSPHCYEPQKSSHPKSIIQSCNGPGSDGVTKYFI